MPVSMPAVTPYMMPGAILRDPARPNALFQVAVQMGNQLYGHSLEARPWSVTADGKHLVFDDTHTQPELVYPPKIKSYFA